MLRLGGRRPGPHPRAGARTQQIDRAIRPESVAFSFQRHVFFMRTPAEFGGLETFRDKTLNRPGVDENAARLCRRRALGVAFGDMNAFDTRVACEPRPILARRGIPGVDPAIGSNIQKRLLDEPGDHARVGAAARYRRGAIPKRAAQIEDLFAQSIIRPLRHRQPRIGVKSRPRLGDCVDA